MVALSKDKPNQLVPEEIKGIYDACKQALETEQRGDANFSERFKEIDELVSKAAKPRSLLYKIIQKIDVAHLFTVSAATDEKFKDLKAAIIMSKPVPPESDTSSFDPSK